jgi:hypothetical protein
MPHPILWTSSDVFYTSLHERTIYLEMLENIVRAEMPVLNLSAAEPSWCHFKMFLNV